MQTLSSRIGLLALSVSFFFFFFGCPPPPQPCSDHHCDAMGGGDGHPEGGAGGGEVGGGAGGGALGGGSGGGQMGGAGGGEMGGGSGGGQTGGGGGEMGGGTGGGGMIGGGGGMGGGGMTGGGMGGGGMTGGGMGGGAGMAVMAAETCTPGSAIATDLALLGQTLSGLADDYQWSGQPGCSPSGTFGPDLAYRLTIPQGQRVTIVATPDDAWDPSLQLAVGCAAGESNVCLAGVNDQGDGVAEVLAFANTGNAPLDAFLVVDTFSPSPTGFTLDVSFAPIAAGDTCSTAAPAGAGMLTGTLAASANDYASGPGCAAASDGPDSVWTVLVPPGNRLTSTVTANATPLADGGTRYDFQPTVNFVVRSCTPILSCSGGAAAELGGGAATARFDNVGASPMPVLVVVDSALTTAAGSFTLSNTLAPFNLPPGDVCGNVGAPLTVDSVLLGETFTGYSNHFSTGTDALGCALADGPDRVYAVTLPPSTRLTATASQAGSNLSLSVVEGAAIACLASPLSCETSAERDLDGAATVTFDNPTGASKSVFVIVDRAVEDPAPAQDVFDFSVSLTPVPPSVVAGESCASATTIGAHTTLSSTTAGLMNDFSAAGAGQCRGGSAAPDGVFQTTVPANSRLIVTATASWDMSLNVLSAPASSCGGAMGSGMVCLGGSDGASGTETVTVTNTDLTAPLTVFILIDGFAATESGDFELSTRVTAMSQAAYTRTTVPQACTPMTGATALLSLTSTPMTADEAVSPTTALPFAFSFFGAPVTHSSVTNNGLLHFFAGGAGAASSAFNNVPIPGSAAPDGFAAPFWDDLNSVPSTLVQSLLTGTAPNRKLTIEWFDATFYGTGRPERLQFQVQLFETTNVIEFHYCSLSANGGSTAEITGASATIGLENQSGTDGVQHSSNAAGAIDTTNAIRFTP